MPEWLIVKSADGLNHFFNHDGIEIDRWGRPLLRKSPELLAKLAVMKQEAKQRTKLNTAYSKEKREEEKQTAEIKQKIESLRENIFHCRCQQEYYRNLLSPVLSQWLHDLDANIAELQKYRNHLLHGLTIAEDMIGELADVMLTQDHQITELQDKLNPPKADSNGHVDSFEKKKKKLESLLGADALSALAAQGVTVEQLLASTGV